MMNIAGLVKRDTVDDIEESLSNMLPQVGSIQILTLLGLEPTSNMLPQVG